MATLKPELRAILDRYGIDPRDTSQVWDCHGTLVLYHKAYEIIAAKENIRFDPPQIIEANGAARLAALCVTGRMGDRVEWSIGEASELNYRTSGKQAAYPWAMAEKRAKDRVVAKLVGLAAYVYSEAEADDLKNERNPVEEPAKPTQKAATTKPAAALARLAALRDGIAACKTLVDVDKWWAANQQAIDALDETSFKAVTAAAIARKRELRSVAQDDRVPIGAMP